MKVKVFNPSSLKDVYKYKDIKGAGAKKRKKLKSPKKKVAAVMHEYKAGTLHSSGSGKKVKKRTEALAIAMSEAGLTKPKKGVTEMKKKRRKRRTVTNKTASPKRKKRRVIRRKKRHNPTRRVYAMKKRRRYTPRKKSYKQRRYRRRRNPSFDFLGVIQTSVLAGIGGVIGLGGTVAVSRIAKVDKNNQKNLITLGIALLSSFMLPKVLKKDQADALLGGLWTVTWLKFLKQVMPSQAQEFLVLGANEGRDVDYLVNRMLGQYNSYDYQDPELELLGTAETFGTAETMGYEFDQYDANPW